MLFHEMINVFKILIKANDVGFEYISIPKSDFKLERLFTVEMYG